MRKIIVLLLLASCQTQKQKTQNKLEMAITFKHQADSMGNILESKSPMQSFEYFSRLHNNDANDLTFMDDDIVRKLLINDSAEGNFYEHLNNAFIMAKVAKNDFLADVFSLPNNERDELLSQYRKAWRPIIDTSGLTK